MPGMTDVYSCAPQASRVSESTGYPQNDDKLLINVQDKNGLEGCSSRAVSNRLHTPTYYTSSF